MVKVLSSVFFWRKKNVRDNFLHILTCTACPRALPRIFMSTSYCECHNNVSYPIGCICVPFLPSIFILFPLEKTKALISLLFFFLSAPKRVAHGYLPGLRHKAVRLGNLKVHRGRPRSSGTARHSRLRLYVPLHMAANTFYGSFLILPFSKLVF